MTDEKKTKSKDSEKVLLIVILAVLAWNSWKIFEIGNVAAKVDKYNQGVVDEMGKMMGNVKLFADDLGEIRRFLLLPEKHYFDDEVKEPEVNTEEQTGSESSLAAFALLDSLVKEQKTKKNNSLAQPVFDALLANKDFQSKIAAAQLKIGEKGELQMKFVDIQRTFNETQQNEQFNQALYNLVFVPAENVFKVQSALGDEVFAEYTSPDFSSKLADYLTQNIAKVREKKAADKKTAELDAKKTQDEVNAQLNLQKKELEDIVKDKAFTETLASIGLKVAEKPREETNKYIFDVVDDKGKVQLSLALEISSGMIKVIRDNEELDINSFLQSEGSKKKP